MSVSATASPPYVMSTSDRLFADDYFGEGNTPTQPHRLGFFAEDSPSFWDVLDVINPLQHVPVVNTFYREMTGDKIGVGARLVGGTLFGGPIGLVASAVNCMIEEQTGRDVGGHALALFRDDKAPPATQMAQAAAETIPQPQPPAEPAPQAIDMPAAPVSQVPRTVAFGSTGFQPVSTAPMPPAASAAAEPAALRGPPSRFMPTPPRASINAPPPPPPLSVPVSQSSQRSNVPITGRNTRAQAPSPAVVQHVGASPGPASAPGNDWFASAMTSALDKYEQTARLGRKDAPTQTLTQ